MRDGWSKLVAIGAVGLLLLVVGGLWGCGTPRERYKVLSFFFDGVPDPDKPVAKATTQSVFAQQRVFGKAAVSVHAPFKQGLCDSCHKTATGAVMDFGEAYKRCETCHKETRKQYPRMHGPVALGECRLCHRAHESTEPHLLAADSIKLCTQCHDAQLLSPKPWQHTDGETPCISCHSGHGGTEANLLNERGKKPWPSTRPTTAPATQGQAVVERAERREVPG